MCCLLPLAYLVVERLCTLRTITVIDSTRKADCIQVNGNTYGTFKILSYLISRKPSAFGCYTFIIIQNYYSEENGIKGFRSQIFLILILIVSLAIAGLLRNRGSCNTMTNYQKCSHAKGNITINSYPRVCRTIEKQSFIDTTQQRPCGRADYTSILTSVFTHFNILFAIYNTLPF
jgi:hypothetical protein